MLKDLRADCEPEAEEERIHERVAEPDRARDNVPVREFKRAAQDNEALETSVSLGMISDWG